MNKNFFSLTIYLKAMTYIKMSSLNSVRTLGFFANSSMTKHKTEEKTFSLHLEGIQNRNQR